MERFCPGMGNNWTRLWSSEISPRHTQFSQIPWSTKVTDLPKYKMRLCLLLIINWKMRICLITAHKIKITLHRHFPEKWRQWTWMVLYLGKFSIQWCKIHQPVRLSSSHLVKNWWKGYLFNSYSHCKHSSHTMLTGMEYNYWSLFMNLA